MSARTVVICTCDSEVLRTMLPIIIGTSGSDVLKAFKFIHFLIAGAYSHSEKCRKSCGIN